MKIEFIKRGAETRLILIFAGWSTDSRYYNDCIVDGWDTAVVSDYRDLSMPKLPPQYTTIYVFAYSLGVFAASIIGVDAAVRIAICGTPLPVSDIHGIPSVTYKATAAGLNKRQLMKFHMRMAGDKVTYDWLKQKLPEDADIFRLQEELIAIEQFQKSRGFDGYYSFNRVYLAKSDRIFPYSNVVSYWTDHSETEMVSLNASHAVDLGFIVKTVIPDSASIGCGFDRAKETYNDAAIVQSEICHKIGEKLASLLVKMRNKPKSVLEIGVGNGLLTREWRKSMMPQSATYIDLHSMPNFGIAEEERYLTMDAEKWLEESNEKFDVILSASTIQWFADPIKFIASLRRHLNPGGVAIVSTFVKGNLKELDSVRPCPLIYRSEEEYMAVSGVDGETWERELVFSSPREMLMHIRKTGVTQKRNNMCKDIKKGSYDNAKAWSELPSKLTYKPMILVLDNH